MRRRRSRAISRMSETKMKMKMRSKLRKSRKGDDGRP